MFDPPDGFKSSSSRLRISAVHEGILATSMASRPSGIDLSCGFQSSRPSGTRSSARRVRVASASNSATNQSVSFMNSPLNSPLCSRFGSPDDTPELRLVQQRYAVALLAKPLEFHQLQPT